MDELPTLLPKPKMGKGKGKSKCKANKKPTASGKGYVDWCVGLSGKVEPRNVTAAFAGFREAQRFGAVAPIRVSHQSQECVPLLLLP
ncbi:hypothetical protein AK812_SmicGene15819 [Symbiodinium microadriaticum]|uniref:Uncharacterized protein n=1 Tax=Symbiodinium microadriaticum TaxID=2951 RepID=A0A1Q9E1Y5_SYMMI|nr:hypothetical protein AK812_SmicGene15819 [Symbiodinium microadriaticum]